MNSANLAWTLVFCYVSFTMVIAQERRIVINSFNHGGHLRTNSLGLTQGDSGTMQAFYVENGRIQCMTPINSPSKMFTMLGSPSSGCLSLPSLSYTNTFMTFRIQFPAGVDARIVLQTGSGGQCGGSMNNELSVRLGDYNALDGMVSWVRIPLTDFTSSYNDLSGRIRALVFEFPSMSFSAHCQIDDLQLVSVPTGTPYFGAGIGGGINSNGMYATSIRSDSRCGRDFGGAACTPGQCCSNAGFCGYTQQHCANQQIVNSGVTYGSSSSGGGWQTPRDDGRCGRYYNWAGCANGQSCSQAGFCGSTSMHYINSQQLGSSSSSTNGYDSNNANVAAGRWGPPRADSRCGRSFGWSGCPSGQSCSQTGFCGSTSSHFTNSQTLGNMQASGTSSAAGYSGPFNPFV